MGPCRTDGRFDQIVVFGDSLSDTGNAGRFSDGPVWVEQLGAGLGLTIRPSQLGGLNFAVGGARLDPASGPSSLRAQADLYLRKKQPTGRTLHIVFGGGNDLLAASQAPDRGKTVDRAAASLTGIVFDLAENGATDILVPNLPDVGMVPALRGWGNWVTAEARRLTDRFNAKVDQGLGEIAALHDSKLYRLDVLGMADRARREPGAFGFTNVTSPCRSLDRCDGYLFWDEVHPTTRAHARLAEGALRLLAEQ